MIFLNSAGSAAAQVFYLPGVCTHTDTEGKQSPEYIYKIRKNTIFNEHPVSPAGSPRPDLGQDVFQICLPPCQKLPEKTDSSTNFLLRNTAQNS